MFEHRKSKLLPRREFYKRLVRYFAIGTAIILGALGIGMLGYHHFDKLPWLDAFENAAMILSAWGR